MTAIVILNAPSTFLDRASGPLDIVDAWRHDRRVIEVHRFELNLKNFLKERFSAQELRTLLRYGPRQPLEHYLPDVASLEALSVESARLLCRNHALDPEFFAYLRKQRPSDTLRASIDALEIQWSQTGECQAVSDTAAVDIGPTSWWDFVIDAGLLEVELDFPGMGDWEQVLVRGAQAPYNLRIRGRGVSFPGVFTMPWSADQIGAIRQKLRGAAATLASLAELNQWGGALRRSFSSLENVLGFLPAQGEGGVVVALQTASRCLQALPWELMALIPSDQGGQPIVLERSQALVRRRPIARRMLPRGSDGRAGSIMFAWSEAGGPVPHAEQAARLEAICTAAGVRLCVCPEATLRKIGDLAGAEASRGTPVRALHLLCHGAALDAQRSAWGLCLERHEVVGPTHIRALIENYMLHLRLLMVHACDSANVGEPSNPLDSVAEAVYFAGVPVIASQFPLHFGPSCVATKDFWSALLIERVALVQAHQRAVSGVHLDFTTLHDWAALTLLLPDSAVLRNP